VVGRGRMVAAAFAGSCAITLVSPMSPALGQGNTSSDLTCPADPTKPSPVTTVLGETFTSPAGNGAGKMPGVSSSLPFTGAEIGVIVVSGIALVGVGGAFVLSTRKPRTHRSR